MRKEEFISVGVSQLEKSGRVHDAKKFSDRVDKVWQDFGEGFAIFISGKLAYFSGDVGAARCQAREFRDISKLPDVRIERVR